MKGIKRIFTLVVLFTIPMSFAVIKKIGDGPVFLTINNKTNKGYLIDKSAQMGRLLRGSTETPLGIVKPNEKLTLSGLEFIKGEPQKVAGWVTYLSLVALNPDSNFLQRVAEIYLSPAIQTNPANPDRGILFIATLTLNNQYTPKEEVTIELSDKQLEATSFIVNVTLEGDNLEKSDIDASAGTGTIK